MDSLDPTKVIPIYTSRGDAEAILVFPNLFNRNGEWIGWVTAEREVYSVLGIYVGYLSPGPRILRKRSTSTLKAPVPPPPNPGRVYWPATIPLAPLMPEIMPYIIDVLYEEPDRLHTLDTGELREDLD
jgi:hypothetical protein